MSGSGSPSSHKVSLVILAYLVFRNSAPSSASAVGAATNLSIWHKENIAPVRYMGSLSCGFHKRKKCPSALLLAYLSDK